MMKRMLIAVLCLWVFPNVGNAQTGENPQTGVWELTWSPDGSLMAAADSTGHIFVLDVTGTVVAAMTGHSSYVYTVARSPDGDLLASGGSNDPFVNLWDVSTGERIRQLYPTSVGVGDPLYGGVGQLAWSPNEAYLLAAAFDTFQFWETTSWTPLEPIRSGSLKDVEWSSDGTLLAVTDPYYLSFFNGQTLLTDDLEHDVIRVERENPQELSWNSTGQLLAATDSLDPRVSIWNVPTRTRIGALTLPEGKFMDVAFIASDRLAAITETGTVYVLDTMGEVLSVIETGVAQVRTLAWNDDLEVIAVAGAETVIDETGVSGLLIIPLNAILSSAE
jgi:WD40 repeat protein